MQESPIRHIIESIIGKKNNRISKSIVFDEDILVAGVQFIKARDRFKRAKLLNIRKEDTIANVPPININ